MLGGEFAAVHDRRAPGRGFLDEPGDFVGHAVAEEDQPVGLLLPDHQGVALFPCRIVLRVAEQHGVPLAHRGLFDALQDQGEERVGDVRHQDQELAGAEHPEILGRGVGLVPEAADRAQHARAGLRRDGGFAPRSSRATPSPSTRPRAWLLHGSSTLRGPQARHGSRGGPAPGSWRSAPAVQPVPCFSATGSMFVEIERGEARSPSDLVLQCQTRQG